MIKNFTHFTPTEITHIKGKINSVGILQKVFPEIWEEILCESNYPKIIGIGRLCRIITDVHGKTHLYKHTDIELI